MKVQWWAIALTTLGISAIAEVGFSIASNRAQFAQAQVPSGAVCRVDGEFGVRCRDLETELQQPPANQQTVVAIDSYDRFIEIGQMRYTEGDSTGAIAYYTQAIGLDSNNPRGYSLRGTAHLSSQQPHDAISDYTRALELSRGIPESDAANFVGRAMSHSRVGQMHEAVIDATQAININPQFAAAYLLRGNAQHRLDNRADACQDWLQAANLYWSLQQHERYTDVATSIESAQC